MTTTPRTDQRLERGQRTRERLIEEGMRLFAQKGFDAVSTRELAQASDANVAAIHFHFKGKAGLYEAVIADVAGRLAALYAGAVAQLAPPGNDPAEAARATISQMIVSLLSSRRSRWMTLLLQREFINPTGGFVSIFETALRPVLEAMAACVEAMSGRPRGRLDNKTLAFSLFVLVSAFSRNRTLFLHWTGRDDYGPGDPARIGEILADFALNGLAGCNGRIFLADNPNHPDGPAS